MESPHPQPDSRVVLVDGQLSFVVHRASGEETRHQVDLLELKLTCEAAEDQHHLSVVNGHLQPTAEFLRDLAGRLAAVGIDGCTPTVAWQAWVSASKEMDRLKKDTGEQPN